MSHFLLLGAGFSRNWGGWLAVEAFEYLLGRSEVQRDETVHQMLWKAQGQGGFEDALAELQSLAHSKPASFSASLNALQHAILHMFEDMNAGFFSGVRFDFSPLAERSLAGFLAHFDVIFSLNQDILLEHRYIDADGTMRQPARWNGSSLPGVRPELVGSEIEESWARRIWVPAPESEFKIPINTQPLFKLHGSSNWRANDGSSMLVIGGKKTRAIGLSPILSWYQRIFEERISEPGARLMIIGYGFRDDHVNRILIRGIRETGLRFFVISPHGADAARAVNPSASAAIHPPSDLEEAFREGLIGASRRRLSEIFGAETIEFNKVTRFFND